MIYYVVETQTGDTGSAIVTVFDNLADAEVKYHDVLRYAVKSNLRKHGCMIVNEDMFIVKSEVYNHE